MTYGTTTYQERSVFLFFPPSPRGLPPVSEALPAGFGALSAGSEALPIGSEGAGSTSKEESWEGLGES